MTDRQADDTAPLAPHRPLTGPSQPATAQATAAPPREQTISFPAPTEPAARPAPPPPARSDAEPAPSDDGNRAAPGAQGSTASQATGSSRARRARLRIVRVDPWSVTKVAFALSMALAIVTVVAVAIVWAVLGAAGVWESINSSVASIIAEDAGEFDVTNYVGLGRVLGLTMMVAGADVILITTIATLGAFLYNLAASLLGGLEVTLSETR